MMPSPSPHQKVESRLGRSLLRPLVKDSDKPELQQLKAMAIEKEVGV